MSSLPCFRLIKWMALASEASGGLYLFEVDCLGEFCLASFLLVLVMLAEGVGRAVGVIFGYLGFLWSDLMNRRFETRSQKSRNGKG